MQKATKQKAVEVLYIDEKQIVRECTRSNIFFVKGNTLITPTEQSILKGVTRKVVIELATKKGIAVTERDIRVKELSGFDECFITGSTIEILPTVKIDSTKIGSGRVGPVTRAMMDYFRSVTS
jgi:branched-subunit amino acid aminotransferase/4-amino-4-deoxychorismate lyase